MHTNTHTSAPQLGGRRAAPGAASPAPGALPTGGRRTDDDDDREREAPAGRTTASSPRLGQ